MPAPDTEAPATGAPAHMDTLERRREQNRQASTRFRSKAKKLEQDLRDLTCQTEVGHTGWELGTPMKVDWGSPRPYPHWLRTLLA